MPGNASLTVPHSPARTAPHTAEGHSSFPGPSPSQRSTDGPLLAALARRFSTIRLVWASGGYAGRWSSGPRKVLYLTVEVAERTDDIKGFKVLPRRCRSRVRPGG